MPRNVCQTAKALDASAPPCVTCANREGCPVQSLHRQVLLAQVRSPVNKQSVVSSCSGYVPPGTDGRVRLDIVDSLSAAGVVDLCAGCTEPAEDGCDERAALEGLRDMAKRAYGIDVSFTTLCCSAKRIPFLAGQPG